MTERVYLAPLRDADSDRLFAWINDRELVVSSAAFKPVARTDHDAWFAAMMTVTEGVQWPLLTGRGRSLLSTTSSRG